MVVDMTTDPTPAPPPVALVTGASRGLGLALAAALARRGWLLVVDARGADALTAAATALPPGAVLAALPGDVADPLHRDALVTAVRAAGRLDLLVGNASVLGGPLRPLVDTPAATVEQVLAVNTLAPLALARALLPDLERAGGRLLHISSDAAVEAYAGWGAYGTSKAALDQLTAVLAVEHPALRVYAVDPGDLATALQQEAFPDDDVSDRPPPESVVPALLRLVEGDLPSGRYRAADLAMVGR